MKKLAIVGTETKTREAAPWNDPEYDIWVFNEAAQAAWCKRYDAVFQMHRAEVYSSPNNMSNAGHWEWLQQAHGKPVYMQQVDPRVPDSARYPIREIMDNLPGALVEWEDRARAWFDCSASYALALALYQGYGEIHIWGMDLASNTEYSYQLGNWRYWIGVAAGAGARVVFHCSRNDFGNGRLYGYEGETQIERDRFTARAERLRGEWEARDRELKRAKERLWVALQERKFDAAQAGIIAYREASIEVGQLAGALAEAESYAAREDMIPRQEFERRAASGQRQGVDKREDMLHVGGMVEYVFNVWQQTGSYEALLQLRKFIELMAKHAYDSGALAGAYHENLDYCAEYDARVTAAGGQKTLASLGVVEA